MQSSINSTLLYPGTSAREIHLPAMRAGIIRFWLPTLIIGIAFFSQHDWQYASADVSYDNLSDKVAEAGGTSLARQLAYSSIGLVGAVMLLQQCRTALRPQRHLLVPFAMLCVLLIASCAWADDTVQSLKRILVLLFVIVGALGIAKQWNFREVLLFAALNTSFFVCIGVAAECLSGSFALAGGHRFGGTQHPNAQGLTCAVLVLASLALFEESRAREGRRMFWLLLMMAGMAFLFFTRSRTSTIAIGASLSAFFLMGASPWKKMVFWLVFVLLASVSVFLWFDSDAKDGFVSAVSMGRDQDAEDVTSLTGRIPMWTTVLASAAERPLLGYGYGGFWIPSRVAYFESLLNWSFMHSHSAYIETLLNLGIVGLGLALVVTIGAMRSAAQSYRSTGNQGYRFVAALLAFALVHGLLDGNFGGVGFESMLALVSIAMIMFHSPDRYVCSDTM